uniref:Uncharacterized protein n=1 Tax=Oryza meridionalis TaxID=40149 RepID=A0A0E0E0M1_9ORYZ
MARAARGGRRGSSTVAAMGKVGSIYADGGGFEQIDATSEKTLTTAAAQPNPVSMTLDPRQSALSYRRRA